MLVSARTSLMNLSIENTIAMPGTSAGLTTASVAASVMKPAPVTPLAPFEVSIATIRMVICWPRVRSTPSACDEQSRQRHVDVGAVEVEGVAGRHHQSHHRL